MSNLLQDVGGTIVEGVRGAVQNVAEALAGAGLSHGLGDGDPAGSADGTTGAGQAAAVGGQNSCSGATPETNRTGFSSGKGGPSTNDMYTPDQTCNNTSSGSAGPLGNCGGGCPPPSIGG